jgi:hypothetical protein
VVRAGRPCQRRMAGQLNSVTYGPIG